jgi:hypothetical protein
MVTMDWTIAFTPNAVHGPPHIGHMWTLAHARYLYEMVKLRAKGRAWPGDVDVKWAVFFDMDSLPEHQSEFLAMADWMGWPFDSCDYAKEWDVFCRNPLSMLNLTFCLPWRDCGMDELSNASKLLWMNAKNVYWHPRGYDLTALESQEGDLIRYLPFRRPIPKYHPVLNDETGVKIGGVGVSDEYIVNRLGRFDPDDVMATLCGACGFDDKFNANIHNAEIVRKSTNIPIVRHIQQFHSVTHGNSWVAHNALHKIINVPKDWAVPL